MKKIILLIIFFCLLLGSIYLVFTIKVSAQKPIRFSYSNFFPFSNFNYKLSVAWAEEIEKRCKGAVKIIPHSEGGGIKASEIYDAVLKGKTDIGTSVMGYTPGRFPAMEFIDLPLGYPNARTAVCVMNKFCDKFDLRNNGKEFGKVKLLYLFGHGPGLIHSKRPVYKLEDLKDIKIRTHGFGVKIIESLGAIPVSMPQGETYSALQKGAVEATLSPLEVLKGWKQAEVIKYTVECSCIGYTAGMFVAMNKDKWESLPDNVQKIFDEVSTEWSSKHGEAWDKEDKAALYYSLSMRNKINPLNIQERARWVHALKPKIEAVAEAAEEEGIPGKLYVETIKKLIEECKKEFK